jgi:NitT/TauT family transport system substrate-binding protein
MLESCGLKESDVTLVNVSDSDIAPSFLANTSQEVVVTWNPMVMEIQKAPGITNIFDSSKIPGEIQDVLAVNSKVLSANPDFARALTGAWYEVMDVMNTPGAEAKAAKTQMAQLATTAMFYTAGDALTYLTSPELKAKMDSVRQFCFTHDLLGENAKSADVVGIQFPDGSVLGDSTNIKLRYDATFTQEYLDGKISLK